MELKEFYYDLPEELIAQVPIKKRDESRLMVLDRKKQTIEHKVFKDIFYIKFTCWSILMSCCNYLIPFRHGFYHISAHYLLTSCILRIL